MALLIDSAPYAKIKAYSMMFVFINAISSLIIKRYKIEKIRTINNCFFFSIKMKIENNGKIFNISAEL